MVLHRGPLLGALEPIFLEKVSTVTEVGIELVEQALRGGNVAATLHGPDNPGTRTYVSVPTLLVTGQEDLPHR
ncbi:hypothetical protein ACFQH2_17940 [Natronoarchaeum sp. GCM10025703]|uniref:hypothetical protein n=1 Tax=unclassified Natronoarchaeum TaxID=2620183 RepID=UPI003620F548